MLSTDFESQKVLLKSLRHSHAAIQSRNKKLEKVLTNLLGVAYEAKCQGTFTPKEVWIAEQLNNIKKGRSQWS